MRLLGVHAHHQQVTTTISWCDFCSYQLFKWGLPSFVNDIFALLVLVSLQVRPQGAASCECAN